MSSKRVFIKQKNDVTIENRHNETQKYHNIIKHAWLDTKRANRNIKKIIAIRYKNSKISKTCLRMTRA